MGILNITLLWTSDLFFEVKSGQTLIKSPLFSKLSPHVMTFELWHHFYISHLIFFQVDPKLRYIFKESAVKTKRMSRLISIMLYNKLKILIVSYLQIITYYSLSAFTECMCHKSKQEQRKQNRIQLIQCREWAALVEVLLWFLSLPFWKRTFFPFAR